jgi:hypothetical protein
MLIFTKEFYKPDVNTQCSSRQKSKKINIQGRVNQAYNMSILGGKPQPSLDVTAVMISLREISNTLIERD